MPKPMAEALGYPSSRSGFADIAALAKDPQGWAKFGHPEWGPFRLGKTNPNFSTSGLNFTVAEYYAATGKNKGLTQEDLARPDVEQFATDLESAVVHYGDTTLTFLNNWYRADARGTALTYTSAVARRGEVAPRLQRRQPRRRPRPRRGAAPARRCPSSPSTPRRARSSRTTRSSSSTPRGSSAEQRQAAELFRDYVLRPENQQRVLEFGFRPGNPDVAVGAPIVPANGVDPAQPQAVLEVPSPPVLVEVLDKWTEQRKARPGHAGDRRVGLDGRARRRPGDETSKLDLAKQAAISLARPVQGRRRGRVCGSSPPASRATPPSTTSTSCRSRRSATQREQLADRISNLVPDQRDAPLPRHRRRRSTTMSAVVRPDQINAVVLLTDGKNEDGDASDDEAQLEELITSLRGSSEGANSQPVRVFAIAYGKDADLPVLRRIAEASNAVAYDASNASTINQVFAAVVSNF